jgi:NAD(P)-dependent dehydrogenase (short-subunit alcohol dehydrogenase family)
MNPLHPAFAAGNVAVITGAASGIGLATARRLAGLGMKLCLADRDGEALQRAAAALAAPDAVLAVETDVARLSDVERLRDQALQRFDRIDLLMNNAGIGLRTGSWEHYDNWRRVLEVNLWGVINGVQAFTPALIAQGRPALIVNTGSKQGITNPPGNTAYNVSKAGVKVLTEGLQHSLRNTAGCQVTAHLLVPGFTFTGMTGARGGDKPAAAWSAEQVVEFMLARISRGDFYILCPDNDVTPEVDAKRILWGAGDLAHNRPALSRWHPDYAEAFAAHMNREE